MYPHSQSKAKRPTSDWSLHRGSTAEPQDSVSMPRHERRRNKGLTETAKPNTDLLMDAIRRVESREELVGGKQTHTWVGVVKRADAAAAVDLAALLQSRDFINSPVIRQTYFRLLIHSKVLNAIIAEVGTDVRSVRRAFAYLLETLLHAFEGLTIELVIELLKLGILHSLASAITLEETLDFRFSLATSLRHMFVNNPVVQKKLALPGNRKLMGSMVQMLDEVKDPTQVVGLATYLREFAVHPDGSLLRENWEILAQYSVQEKARKAKDRLSLATGKHSDEREKAVDLLTRIEEIKVD